MLILRPTASLAKRMGVRLPVTAAESTTVLGDWYANSLVLEKRQYTLCLSENGRLPVILPAAPYSELPLRFAPAVGVLLRSIGVPEARVQEELLQMDAIVLAKTDDRSILGSLNEMIRMAQANSDMGRFNHRDLSSMSVWLSNVISLVLKNAYTPQEDALRLFGLPAKPSRRLRLVSSS